MIHSPSGSFPTDDSNPRPIPAQPRSHDDVAHYLATGMREPALSPPATSNSAESRQNPQTAPAMDPAPESDAKPARHSTTADHAIIEALCREGLSRPRAQQVYATFGAATLRTMRADPYRLAQVRRAHIPFAVMDKMALREGVSRGDPRRIEAGLRHCVSRSVRDGHCAIPCDRLLGQASGLLNVDGDPTAAALQGLLDQRELVHDTLGGTQLIYSPALYAAECGVAHHVRRLQAGVPPWGRFDVATAVREAERALNLTLSPSQRAAALAMPLHTVCIITGGPGTGKTTLLKVLLHMLRRRVRPICLTAPLGRVARDLTRRTGERAATLHRVLGASPDTETFSRSGSSPLEHPLVIVDELSLVDVMLGHALVSALRSGAGLLLLGDVHQLPSVGPGKLLRDLIDSNTVPTLRLTEIHRQRERSNITFNAERALAGALPLVDPEREPDFEYILEDDLDALRERITQLYVRELPRDYGFDPQRDVQILTPRRHGTLSASDLNPRLQHALQPRSGTHLTVRGMRLAVGDRVMHEVNDDERDVYNGEIGFIEAIDSRRRSLHVHLVDRTVTYTFAQAQQLTLAYAYNVHRAQGSEFPAVIVPVTTADAALLSRSFMSTAYARGRDRVIAIGQARAFELALREGPENTRVTGLCERLRASAGRSTGRPQAA